MIPILYLALWRPAWSVPSGATAATGTTGHTGAPQTTVDTNGSDTGGAAGSDTGGVDTGSADTAGGDTASPDTGSSADSGVPVGVSAASLAGEVGGCHCDNAGRPLQHGWFLWLALAAAAGARRTPGRCTPRPR